MLLDPFCRAVSATSWQDHGSVWSCDWQTSLQAQTRMEVAHLPWERGAEGAVGRGVRGPRDSGAEAAMRLQLQPRQGIHPMRVQHPSWIPAIGSAFATQNANRSTELSSWPAVMPHRNAQAGAGSRRRTRASAAHHMPMRPTGDC